MVRNDRVFKISPNDNVAILLEPIKKGEYVNSGNALICVREDIDVRHKISIEGIKVGENVIKYGMPIGHASRDIVPGEFVHTHNVKTNLDGLVDYSYSPKFNAHTQISGVETFWGYIRENGEIGTRNEIWIINTTGCVNKTAETLARLAMQKFAGKTGGIYSFAHPYGCSQLGNDHLCTQRILADLVKHPNAAGVLVLSLGCENNNLEEFKEVIGDQYQNRVKFMVAQDVSDEIETGLDLIEQLVEYSQCFKRERISVSKLKVGLKCGASDGFSGITANPLVGVFSDKLIANGGTVLLSEVPEMFGAEKILMERCADGEVFEKTVKLINDFKKYFLKYNQKIYENPSPGNKKSGISTLEEKSLGCVQKGGTSVIVDVLRYGDRATKTGLNLLEASGNDIITQTALTAAGAHVILFTTGNGNPLGAPVPTVKISSNTDLAIRKKEWVDFNAGQLLEGKSMEHLTKELFSYILDLASGEIQTKNEENGYREISIFKDGVIL